MTFPSTAPQSPARLHRIVHPSKYVVAALKMTTALASLFGRLQDMVQGSGVRYIHNSDAFTPASVTLPLPAHDRRVLTKTFKLMDDVVKACQSHRLNLKNSPPFILDILPDTYTHLILIFTQNANALRDYCYLQIFIDNMQQKCKQVLKLFRTSAIFSETSAERRTLTKLSLTFSHMLYELKAEFPEGNFIGDKFRITKKEAEDFWQKNFPKTCIATWGDFIVALENAHSYHKVLRQSTLGLSELKQTIDLTGNDHVSNFEFDVFTRLFYPWKTLLKNWQLLTTAHPGYVAFLTYDEVKKKLEGLVGKPGSYVFRLSCTRPGQWAIGYVAPDGRIYQTIPQNKSLIQALHEGNKEGFYLYPNGRSKNVDLDKYLEMPTAERVKVTSEQYDLYCEMGTTFELCKICDDRDKNIKIEPCGHLLCAPCLTSWQDSEGGNTCPFCRYEIKGTNKVVIDRFKPKEKSKEKSAEKEAPRPPSLPPPKEAVRVTLLEDLPVGPPPPIPPRPNRKQPITTERSYSDPNYVNMPAEIEAAVIEHRPSLPNIIAPVLPPLDNRDYVNSSVLRVPSRFSAFS